MFSGAFVSSSHPTWTLFTTPFRLLVSITASAVLVIVWHNAGPLSNSLYLVMSQNLMLRAEVNAMSPPESAKNQARVLSSQTKGIGQGNVNLGLPGHVGNVVQVTLRVWVVQIDSGMYLPVPNRQN